MKNKKKNFIWNLLGTTANAFVSLFFLIIINRINGKIEAGIFSYTFSLACLFYIIALYYNRTYQVSDVESNFHNNQYIVNRIITSLITIILIIVFALINKFNFYKSSMLVLLTVFKVLEALSDCFHAFIQKKDQLYFVGKSLFFKAILGILGFILIDFSTKSIILSILFLIIVNLVGLIIEIKKYKSLYKMKFNFTFNKFNNLMKETLPLFLFSFLNIYLCNCQKYILDYFMTEEYQTILGIIIMPATMLSLCGQYLIAPYINELSLDYQRKKIKKFNQTFSKINFFFIIISILIFIIALLLGIPMLNLIYNIELNNYKLSFIIIIAGAIFYALSALISNILIIMKKNKEQFIIFVVSSVVSTILSIVLIRNYEIMGASIAYVITMIIHLILSYMVFKINNNKKCN